MLYIIIFGRLKSIIFLFCFDFDFEYVVTDTLNPVIPAIKKIVLLKDYKLLSKALKTRALNMRRK